MTVKVCIRCGGPPLITQVRTYSYCKACDSLRKKNAYQQNRTRELAKAADRRARLAENPNPCSLCGGNRGARVDCYCKPCRDAYNRDWYSKPKNKERALERRRVRYNGPGHEDERLLRARYRWGLKLEAIAAYGGKCACCGEEHPEMLALDHIAGNGKDHRRQASSTGAQFYAWLRRRGWPREGLRVLCHNCNFSFGAYGYCPHDALPSNNQQQYRLGNLNRCGDNP